MKENTLISIVLTLYNKSPYIEETIFSIYKQTYSNWELIIVDDCSTDWSFEIAKSFCEKLWITKKCKFIKNEKNLWVAKTFERWLKEAKWDWISMCDWDDIMMKNKLEENLDFCKKNHLSFCHSDLIVINKFNNIASISRANRSWINVYNNKFNNIISHNNTTWTSIFFSKELKKELISIWFPENVYQDWRVTAYASLKEMNIWFINKPLVYYRRCDSCITADKDLSNNNNKLENWKELIRKEISISQYIIEHLGKSLNNKKLKWIETNYIANTTLLKFLNSMEISKFLTLMRIIFLKKFEYSFIYKSLVTCIRCFIRNYKLKNE